MRHHMCRGILLGHPHGSRWSVHTVCIAASGHHAMQASRASTWWCAVHRQESGVHWRCSTLRWVRISSLRRAHRQRWTRFSHYLESPVASWLFSSDILSLRLLTSLQVAQDCVAAGAASVHVYAGDLASEEAAKTLMAFSASKMGAIDVLVCPSVSLSVFLCAHPPTHPRTAPQPHPAVLWGVLRQ